MMVCMLAEPSRRIFAPECVQWSRLYSCSSLLRRHRSLLKSHLIHISSFNSSALPLFCVLCFSGCLLLSHLKASDFSSDPSMSFHTLGLPLHIQPNLSVSSESSLHACHGFLCCSCAVSRESCHELGLNNPWVPVTPYGSLKNPLCPQRILSGPYDSQRLHMTFFDTIWFFSAP